MQITPFFKNKHFELCCFIMYRVRNIVNRRESDVIRHSVRRSRVLTSVTYYHNKWGGLMVNVFASIPKVKGSNFMGGVVCGQQWYVDRIFSYEIFRIGA